MELDTPNAGRRGWWLGAAGGVAVITLSAAISTLGVFDGSDGPAAPSAACEPVAVAIMPTADSSMDVVYVNDSCERVAIASTASQESSPALSEETQRIAFVRRTNDATTIVLAAADGSAERVGLAGVGDIGGLAWSPDSSAIAYWRTNGSGISQIWRLDVETGKSTQLTRLDSSSAQPDWSPDGTSLAFTVAGASGSRIGVVDAQGGEVNLLTPEGIAFKTPLWSPDGASLAAIRVTRDDSAALTIISSASGEVKRATALYGLPLSADWSRRGLSFAIAGSSPMHTTVTQFDAETLEVDERTEFLGIPGKEAQ